MQSIRQFLTTIILLFSVGNVTLLAQNVPFEDPIFKKYMLTKATKIVNGQHVPVNSNGDGEIQMTEALDCQVWTAYCAEFESNPGTNLVYESCTSISGIEYFTNTIELKIICPHTVNYTDLRALSKLTKLESEEGGPFESQGQFELDLRGLTNLRELSDDSSVHKFNVEGCTSLQSIYLDHRAMRPHPIIDLRGLTNLSEFIMPRGYVDEILFEENTALKTLLLEENGWASNGFIGYVKKLDLRGAPNLEVVRTDCKLNEVNVQGLIHLDTLHIESRELTGEITMASLPELEYLYINFMDDDLTLGELPQLQYLFVNGGGSTDNRLTTTDFQAPLTYCNVNSFHIDSKATFENMTELTYLQLSGCGLNEINLDNLMHLETCNLRWNQLESINLDELPLLKTLILDVNQFSELHIQNLLALEVLDISNCETLENLTLNNLPQLSAINVNKSALTELNISDINSLKKVNAWGNHLESVTIDLPWLNEINLSGNRITQLDIAPTDSLEIINIADNLISSFDFIAFPNLVLVDAFSNSLEKVKFDGHKKLGRIWISENQLNEVQITDCPSLSWVNLANNQLSNFDLSASSAIVSNLILYGNPLEYLNLKDGHKLRNFGNDQGMLHFSEDIRVCIDEDEQENVMVPFEESELTSYTISTFCPGFASDDFYAINGQVRYDSDDNGCDNNDDEVPYAKFLISNDTEEGFLLTNGQGILNTYFPEGVFTIEPSGVNVDYFEYDPQLLKLDFPGDGLVVSQDFCLQKVAEDFNDLQVVLMPLNSFSRPGFESEYKLIYSNIGNTVLDATVSVYFDEGHTQFVSSAPAMDSANGTLTLGVTQLKPFETGEVKITMRTSAPPILSGGEELVFRSEITEHADEVNPNDNTAVLRQPVRNSFDPNDKTCLEGHYVDPEMIGDFLHYRIRFENTGSASAINIIVRDTIDETVFNISTLEVIDASHSLHTSVDGNLIEFIFEQIHLPFNDASNDGYVLFRIKTWSDLSEGDLAINSASIYFDYNLPIHTNTAESTFILVVDEDGDGFNNLLDCDDNNPDVHPNAEEIANNDLDDDCDGEEWTSNTYDLIGLKVDIFPNPASDLIYIESNTGLSLDIKLYDMYGTILRQGINLRTMNVYDIAQGTYFLHVLDKASGSRITEKIIIAR